MAPGALPVFLKFQYLCKHSHRPPIGGGAERGLIKLTVAEVGPEALKNVK